MPIFDQGYQHWQGHLAGHGWRWLAVTRHGIRAGMKSMFLRIVIIFAWIPALVLAGVICLWGLVEQKTPWAISMLGGFGLRDLVANPALFRMTMWTLCFHYFILWEIAFVMLLVMMVGPGLISQDLRFNALPLYFSRPVRRIDYFFGKLGVIGFFLGLVSVVPAVAAWCLGILFSLDFTVIFDTFRILLATILYGFVVTLSAGLLMLALSSLSRNSRYVGAFWAGIVLLTLFISLILEGIHLSSVFRNQAMRNMEIYREQNEARNKDNAEEMQDANNVNMLPDERARRAQARRQRQLDRQEAQRFEQDRFQRQIQHDLAESFKNDWRPTVSYMSDLLRIGDGLLGTYEARDKLGAMIQKSRAQPVNNLAQPENDDSEGYVTPEPRWPWSWSALILIALGGLSVWILNTRVKNLDRLR